MVFKSLFRNPRDLCIICVFHDIFRYSVLGIVCIDAECDHTSGVRDSDIRISVRRVVSSLMMGLLIAWYSVYELSHYSSFGANYKTVSLVSQFTKDLLVVVLLLDALAQTKQMIRCLGVYQCLLDSFWKYGNREAFFEHRARYMMILRGGLTFTPLLYVLYVLAFFNHLTHHDLFLFVITTYCRVFVTWVLMVSGHFFISLYFLHVKDAMEKIRGVLEATPCVTNGGYHGKRFKISMEFYLLNLKLLWALESMYRRSFLLIFAAYLPTVSADLVVFVSCFFDTGGIDSSCLEHLLIGGVILSGLTTFQRIGDITNDILSFLFKYPISKLTPSEAAQVEMLITTLTLQRPVLRASDIFTVGTRLLASISGTVVTYVLVALQFHASWAD